MKYDYSKLSGKIKECCGNQLNFSNSIGLSERSVSLKMNGKREWKQSEIDKTCKVLKIEHTEIPLYFFTPLVQF